MKTPIPGTPWLRVITTEGNTFYTHTGEKRSVWTVPEEIKEAVEQLEREEALKKEIARAEEEGLSKAEFIRRSLAKDLHRPKRRLPYGIGSIKGGPSDMSANIDRYLSETGFGELPPERRR